MPQLLGDSGRPMPPRSSSSMPRHAGKLELLDSSGKVTRWPISSSRELIIGRDRSKCQLIVDDPCVSAKHLRIYTVVYDNDDATEVDTLVYAEDLSRNGTYWNGSLIGRGNGGFLLSTGDVLKLSSSISIRYEPTRAAEAADSHFDGIQEREMAKFGRSYIVTDRLLGAGAFGKVFMAIEQTARTQLACKVVDLRRLQPRFRFERPETALKTDEVNAGDQARRVKQWGDKQKRHNKWEVKLKAYYSEAEILASVRHPNIIGLEKVFVTDNTIYMFQDLVSGGDLFSYLESKQGRLSEVEAAVILRQIVIAICFLHEKSIVHRDLKPDNILMTSLSTGCRVVLTDFGAARRLPPKQRLLSVAGTEEYAAPEMIVSRPSGVGHTKSVDLWALGCVAVILLTGASAFTDPGTQQYSPVLASQCNLVSLQKSKDWQAVRPRPKDFVHRLLVLDEDQRMTAPEALEHGWFSNEVHKTNFEEAYQRAIKHWRPRPTRTDIFQFSDASGARRIARAQGVIPEKSRGTSPRPKQGVESHYQPFPRQIHSSLLWPKRKPTPLYIAPETKAAMDKWSPSGASDTSDREEPETFQEPDLSDTPSKRRGGFSINPPARRHSTLPSKQGTAPARVQRAPTSARSADPPSTPAHKLRTASAPTTIPLRPANANPKLQPTLPRPSPLKTPARLGRWSEAYAPNPATNTAQKKRRSSIYDFDDAENDVSTVAHKRPKGNSSRDAEDLDLPHHASVRAEDE